MLHTDFHTHTTFCDGKSTPREMVEAAYRMGMTDLGVSGHADFSMFEPGFGMDDEKLRQYTEELQELREEYRGKMNLYIGIERMDWDRCRKQSTRSARPMRSSRMASMFVWMIRKRNW